MSAIEERGARFAQKQVCDAAQADGGGKRGVGMSDHLISDLPGGLPEESRTQGASADDLGRVVWIPGEFDEQAWRRTAACRDVDPEVFFPVGSTGPAIQQIADAKDICRGCPVRLVCLQYALANHHDDGVWGGYDEGERRELRRRWRRLGSPLRFVPAVSSAGADVLEDAGPSDWTPEAS
jgi:WhiB family redox-sensing transcriptional regulator